MQGSYRDIADSRYDQAQERLTQGQKVLAGTQSLTPLIDDEREATKSLEQSQIKSLEVAAVLSQRSIRA